MSTLFLVVFILLVHVRLCTITNEPSKNQVCMDMGQACLYDGMDLNFGPAVTSGMVIFQIVVAKFGTIL